MTTNSSTSTISTWGNENVVLHSILPWIRILALVITGIAIFWTIYCIIWLYYNKKKRIVASHQPELLIIICFGVLLWDISVIPLSIDDTVVASQRGNDVACMAYPWLYDIGFAVVFAGLFSKLWRINKIFHNPQYRRIAVKIMDVVVPYFCIFTPIFILLLLTTIIDPLRWKQESYIDGSTNYAYGYCSAGDVHFIFYILLSSVRIFIVLITIYQAYLARNISSDFSETWPLALALLNWIQLAIIYFPLNVLILDVVPSASYFLDVSVIIAQSKSILFAVFLPLYLHPSIRQSPRVIGSDVRITRVNNDPVITGVTYNNTIRDDDEMELEYQAENTSHKEPPNNYLMTTIPPAVNVDTDRKIETSLENGDVKDEASST